ncbi:MULTISPECIES: lysozyme inhibitor LprI family protein [Burkholderia cepacia complex]|uniref:lysozyme inhibitor LprI family protein n=1 Tax=Burkholderia cepacia complex TaxID=87882 RepID=UPI0015892199|nr:MULTISPECIES: lysozyme inhibitor LprI family protein [Burkholderia cepacia complex]MCA8037102.1 lysozyme inhibitor LprI family protein [Burkholderia arboris]
MKTTLFTLLLAGPVLAYAAGAKQPDLLGDCMDKATAQGAMIKSATADCLAEEAKRQDAKLNATYKQAMKSLPAARQKKLVVAQRAWITFRDANCAIFADSDGDALAEGEVASCVADLTAERAKGLREIANSQ